MTHHSRQQRARLMVVAAVVAACAATLAGISPVSPPSTAPATALPSGSPSSTGAPGLARAGWTAQALDPNDALQDVSCGAPGNCAAIGYTEPGDAAFLVSEVNGIWQRPMPEPGMVQGNSFGVDSVSCASAGICTAVGGVFAVSEVRGTWQQVTVLPGQIPDDLEPVAVSCGSAGNCTAVGDDSFGDTTNSNLLAVNEVNGTWQRARQIPGFAALARRYQKTQADAFSAKITWLAVSCASPGSCAVGGGMDGDGDGSDVTGQGIPFVASQISGTWHQAEIVPGARFASSIFGSPPNAVDAVSCAAAGSCSAAGEDASGHAFAVNEVGGTWRHLNNAPGLPGADPDAVLDGNADNAITSVSCSAPGTCTAGGYTKLDRRHAQAEGLPHGDVDQAFVVSETGGIWQWQRAAQVPGLAALAKGRDTAITSVSCSSPGTCAAGGTYGGQVFLASQVNGIWGRAVPLPGQGKDSDGGASVEVSCPRTGPRTLPGVLRGGVGGLFYPAGHRAGHRAGCGGIANVGSAEFVLSEKVLSAS